MWKKLAAKPTPASIVAAVGACLFTLYTFLNRGTGLGFFDTSEYSFHIGDGGLPHAPGYPLYVLLGKAALLFTDQDPFLAQFIVSWLAALGVAFFLWKTFQGLDPEKSSGESAALIILLFFSSYFIKLYTLLPEVFLLNLFLFSGLIYCACRLFATGQDGWLFPTFVFYGLGFCHHHTLALTLPAFFLLYFLNRTLCWRDFGISLGGFAVGCLPLVYMFTASNPPPDYAYYYVHNWNDFLFMIFRKGYGTFSLTVFQTSASMKDIFTLVGRGLLTNFNYLGWLCLLGWGWILMSLKQSPPNSWGRRFKEGLSKRPDVTISVFTLVLFFIIFVPKNNIPLTFEKYKHIVLRFVTIPALLFLYPFECGLRSFLERFSGRRSVLFGMGALLLLFSNGVGWKELRFRNYDILDQHIKRGFETILSRVDPVPYQTVDPRYMKCAIFTRPDALVFGVRYYNVYKSPRRCFLFTTASFTDQFRARHEAMLQQQVFGNEYLPFIIQNQNNPNLMLGELFTRLNRLGFKIFLFYPTDSVLFAHSGIRYRPVGNIQELVFSNDNSVTIKDLLGYQSKYLHEMDLYLKELKTRALPQILLDESIALGLFQNLDEYRKLTQPYMQHMPGLTELDAEVRGAYQALSQGWKRF